MAQFLRPSALASSSNISAGTYTDVNEESRLDSTYVIGTNALTATAEFTLPAPGGTPGGGTCTVRYTWVQGDHDTSPFVEAGIGNGWNTTTVAIREGTTEIATSGAQTNTATWQAGSFTFSTAAVGNWSNLNLLVTLVGNGGSPTGRRTSATSWLEVEVPDAAAYSAKRLALLGVG